MDWIKSVIENYEGPPLTKGDISRMLFQKLTESLPQMDSLLDNMIRVAIAESNGNPINVYRVKEEAVYHAVWGTYGPNGDEPLKYVRLIDCSTDHLRNILRTQKQIDPSTRDIINKIFDMRGLF